MKNQSTGTVSGIIANLAIIKVEGPVAQNEVCYLRHKDTDLMAEVIKIRSGYAYAQVFESTRGIKVGTPVRFMGHLLEATLGPGILSRNYDGLMHDLGTMSGIFLQRGEYTDALDKAKLWHFKPLAQPGDTVQAGTWLGEVQENAVPHRIMVPFMWQGSFTVQSVAPEGEYRVEDEIATLSDASGRQLKVTMTQQWPVKQAVRAYVDKPRPYQLLETGVRTIDTLNPIVEGGTGFIPGPFGSGKTVLQQAISRQADADVVIVAACGERANEVVELFKEFPELDDPWHPGRRLMERTVIIANTSNMPVAAREASVYTAMTIAEYYRSMGLKVLLLADSTSRWAQALREMSNRMEELPGPDAFPMDLSAIISNFYSRAGMVRLSNNQSGSITFIGTVSPAGGNLKEPVTESTRKAARCFYALSQQRADSKRYPAIDPIDSYSKYLEYPELQETLAKAISPDWVDKVNRLKNILLRGKEAAEQINILGDDGVTVDYHLTFWRSEVVDAVILQQDAFDSIDARTPLARQQYMTDWVLRICDTHFQFDSFEQVNPYFKRVVNQMKQMNYSEFESEQFRSFEKELEEMLREGEGSRR
ncbi:MAG TPA: V-type ATP synthase subunit A [Saprospiraceae bacterium]|nr:V-type ATP synthase subunit A [Saprospiraceae bacterium]